MANNTTLTFDNHDTYVYYSDEIFKSTQQVILTPTNPDNNNLVKYLSREASLFTNGKNNGTIKLNSFNSSKNLFSFGSAIGTIITNDGILMYNYAAERNSSNLTIIQQIKALATYKSGKYANYLNVEIQIDFEDTYRIVTISY